MSVPETDLRLTSPPRRPEPSERIDPRALRAWRLAGALSAIPGMVVAIGLTVLFWRLDFSWYITGAPIALASIFALARVWFIPSIEWRRWRYDVTEREIDLQHGMVILTRTIIPMTRVQHVDTRQGPILRHFGLASVEIATAAGAQQIPALSLEVANTLRDRIAQFAGVAEDV